MPDFNEIKTKADDFRKAKNYAVALPLYENLWKNFKKQCSKWDGWGYAFCLQKLEKYQEALNVCREVYPSNKDFEQIKSVYGWCIYYTEIKVDKVDDENKFLKAANGILQLSNQEDNYSPYTNTALKVLDYFDKKNLYNAKKILEWTSKINPDLLSTDPFSFTDSQKKKRENASPKEKYFSHLINALFENEQYKNCIELCNTALNSIPKFHYKNEIWFKRKIAQSKFNLNQYDEALLIYEEIIKREKDWFIQKEIADIYFIQNKFDEALKYSVEAALNVGEDNMKVELFKLLAMILSKKGKTIEAKKHIEFAYIVKQENEHKIKDDFIALVNSYKIDTNKLKNYREQLNEMRNIWQMLKFGKQEIFEGRVKKILPDGKSGFISGDNGKDFFFSFKNFIGNGKLLVQGLRVSFFLEDSFDKKKNLATKIAVNIKTI